jgi:hypothetical protein
VVVTTGFTGSFLSVISGAMYYATPENNWDALFTPNLSRWLSPTDTQAVRLFYEGLPRGMQIPWDAWATPLATWMSFILVFYGVLFCLGVLLRGQWVENERLVFPLTKLPLAMVDDEDDERSWIGSLFTSRVMWIGFAIPLLLHTWNSMGNYSDAFQKIPVVGNVTVMTGLPAIPFRLNLPVIGLAYLMPLNVAFSMWFFFLIGQAQRMILSRVGIQIGTGDIWTSGAAGPIISYQQSGAMMVFVAFLLWTAMPHIRRLWRQAAAGERGDEVLHPRTAFAGLIAGACFMVAWLTVTGLAFYVAVILVFGALGAFIGLSRIVAEAGLPGAQTPMVPQAFITRGFGPEVLGEHDERRGALAEADDGRRRPPPLPRHAAGAGPGRRRRARRVDLVHHDHGLRSRWHQSAQLVLRRRGAVAVQLHGVRLQRTRPVPAAPRLHQHRRCRDGAAAVPAPPLHLVAPAPDRLPDRQHLHDHVVRVVRHLPRMDGQERRAALRRDRRVPLAAALLPRADPRRVHYGLCLGLPRRDLRLRREHDLQLLRSQESSRPGQPSARQRVVGCRRMRSAFPLVSFWQCGQM